MKRRDLLRALRLSAKEAGVDLAIVRNGASHDIYRLGDLVITIPRHNELNEMTARGILKDAAAHLKGRDR